MVVAVGFVGLIQDGDLGSRGIAAGDVRGQLHSAKSIVADVKQGEDVASGVEGAVTTGRLNPGIGVAEERAAVQLKVFILVELGVVAVGERADQRAVLADVIHDLRRHGHGEHLAVGRTDVVRTQLGEGAEMLQAGELAVGGRQTGQRIEVCGAGACVHHTGKTLKVVGAADAVGVVRPVERGLSSTQAKGFGQVCGACVAHDRVGDNLIQIQRSVLAEGLHVHLKGVQNIRRTDNIADFEVIAPLIEVTIQRANADFRLAEGAVVVDQTFSQVDRALSGGCTPGFASAEETQGEEAAVRGGLLIGELSHAEVEFQFLQQFAAEVLLSTI